MKGKFFVLIAAWLALGGSVVAIAVAGSAGNATDLGVVGTVILAILTYNLLKND